MSERTPFSTWHVVLMIMAILFMVFGFASLAYSITHWSLNSDRDKHWTIWFFFALGIALIILGIVMMLAFWWWHRRNKKHCSPEGWASCPSGGVRPSCGKEALESKHVTTPLVISKGPPTQQVLHGHHHVQAPPVFHSHTTSHVHVPHAAVHHHVSGNTPVATSNVTTSTVRGLDA